MDSILKKDYHELLISNFMYSPKIRPIKNDSISFVMLTAINNCEKPELYEIKEEFRKLSGIDIKDESILEKTFLELRKKEYIEIQTLKCTEKGKEYLKQTSLKYEYIKNSVESYFKKEFNNLYLKKYCKYNDLNSESWRILFDMFWYCLEHIACIKSENIKTISTLKIRGRESSESCTRCYDTKNKDLCKELDYRIMEVYHNLIDRIIYNHKLPEIIEEIITIFQYSLIVKETIPINQDIRKFFEEDIKNKYFYIDTNVLIIALTQYDNNYLIVDFLLRKLKKINEGHLNIFWNKATELEFENALESSKSLIRVMECYPTNIIHKIISNLALPSFVQDYFVGNWHNIESYEKYIKARYRKLYEYSEETKEKLPKNFESLDKDLAEFISEEMSKHSDKTPLRLEHDTTMVVGILNLRKLSEINFEKGKSLISDYWIITFDENLIRLQYLEEVKRKYKHYGIQPVCIGLKTLKILIEPYIISKSTEFSNDFEKIEIEKINEYISTVEISKMPIADLCKGLDVDIKAQQELIGKYLNEANLEEFKIKYGN